MRLNVPLTIAVLAACVLELSAQKPQDVSQKEEALKAATKSFQDSERAIRRTFEAFERSLATARADEGAVWIAEMGRALEGLSTAIKATVAKGGRDVRGQVVAVIKKDAPAAFRKLEHEDLIALEPYLSSRLSSVSADLPLDPAALEPKPIAQQVLADLLGEKPVHDLWNETLADLLPVAEAYRKAAEQLERARWDYDIAKDPILSFQRGAPAGFAKVPAGSYVMLGTSAFGATGTRKGKKPVSLPRDVYVGLREVTHAEYFDWWRTLDEESKKLHLPEVENQPMWPTPDGAPGPEMPPELATLPVSGITIRSAIAYAAARGARLPTEAEWCAAAGGREGRLYPWGDSYQPDACNDLEHKRNDLVPVGSMPQCRGPFGHFDLSGNVAEMVATYESGKDIDPTKVDDQTIVVRGGAYTGGKDEVSNGWVWYRRARDERTRETGFRLAMDVKK